MQEIMECGTGAKMSIFHRDRKPHKVTAGPQEATRGNVPEPRQKNLRQYHPPQKRKDKEVKCGSS